MSKPSVPELDKLLDDLVNWQRFAVHLPGIHPSNIRAIESNKRDDVADQKLALYEIWLQVYPDASWEDVTAALKTIKENKLAKDILFKKIGGKAPSQQTQSLFFTGTDETNSIKVKPKLVENLKGLEESFDTLSLEVKNDVRSSVASGKVTIASLVNRTNEQQRFAIEYPKSEDPEDFFRLISPLYNFLNCFLLIRLAFCLSVVIKEKARKYDQRIEDFKKSKNVKDLRKSLRQIRSNRKPTASNLVRIIVEDAWGDQSIWLVEKLLQMLFPLQKDELQWYKISTGSIIMCFIAADHRLLSLILGICILNYMKTNFELMRTFGVMSLTIGDVFIPVNTDKGKRFSLEDVLIYGTLVNNVEVVQFLLQYTKANVNVKNAHLGLRSFMEIDTRKFDFASDITLLKMNQIFHDVLSAIQKEVQHLKEEGSKPIRESIQPLEYGCSYFNVHILNGLSARSLVPEKISKRISMYDKQLQEIKHNETIRTLHKILKTYYRSFRFRDSLLSSVTITVHHVWLDGTIAYFEEMVKLLFSSDLFERFSWFDANATGISFLVAKTHVPSVIQKCKEHKSLAKVFGVKAVHIDSKAIIEQYIRDDYSFIEAVRQAQQMRNPLAIRLLMQISQRTGENNAIEDENKNVYFIPDNDATPLMIACCNDNSQLVRLLLDHNADTNVHTFKNYTALIHSTRNNKIFRILLDRCTDDGTQLELALTTACIQGNDRAVKMLLIRKPLLIKWNVLGQSILSLASETGYSSVVRQILKAGANLNIPREKDNKTPLTIACRHGHLSVVKELLHNNANPNIADLHGNTSLLYASSYGHLAVVEQLLKAQVDLNFRREDGGTALHAACAAGHVEIVKQLLKAGANVNIQNKDGATPFTVAYAAKHLSIARILYVLMTHQDTLKLV